MSRTLLRLMLAVALAGIVVAPSTSASLPPVHSAFLMRLGPERFPDDGSATSAIRVFAGDRISVYTRLIGQRPGGTWSVEIFDAGTCSSVLATTASLGSITIGPDGIGSRTSYVNPADSSRIRDALAAGRRLVARLTGSEWRTCQTYSEVDPAVLGSRTPTTNSSTSGTGTTAAVTSTTGGGTSVTTTSATTATSLTTATTQETTVSSTTVTVTTVETTVSSPSATETTPVCIPTPDEDCEPDGPDDEE